jgi:hypothetical protein
MYKIAEAMVPSGFVQGPFSSQVVLAYQLAAAKFKRGATSAFAHTVRFG